MMMMMSVGKKAHDTYVHIFTYNTIFRTKQSVSHPPTCYCCTDRQTGIRGVCRIYIYKYISHIACVISDEI